MRPLESVVVMLSTLTFACTDVAVRGLQHFVDSGVALVDGVDPAVMCAKMSPQIDSLEASPIF